MEQSSSGQFTRLWQRYEAIAFPMLVFLVLRLVTGVVAFVIIQQNPVQPAEWIYLNPSGATYALTLPADAPMYSLTTPWHRYDTLWYTKNAPCSATRTILASCSCRCTCC